MYCSFLSRVNRYLLFFIFCLNSSLGSAEIPPQAPVLAQSELPSPAPITEDNLAAGIAPDTSAEPGDNAVLNANPRAENIDLEDVVTEPGLDVLPSETLSSSDTNTEPAAAIEDAVLANGSIRILGVEVPPSTSTRLTWEASRSFSGLALNTPVLVVNGARQGKTLCLTAAIHGDELNGIEMVRRVMYSLQPERVRGTVIGVPIVNLMSFSHKSRYLPDRRDLNRHFPGTSDGSAASRLAFSVFNDIVSHCDALVDLHTGSFHRTNITQLRADLSNKRVVELTRSFGDIPVLNTPGNDFSLRAAAVAAGIPAVTMEAGEPLRLQKDVVQEGVEALNILMDKMGITPRLSLWAKPKPAFYRSYWVRVNSSGILFSDIALGAYVEVGALLGTVTNPVTNARDEIISPYKGRVLGMALDQFVLPGFAAYHIGIMTTEKSAVDQSSQPDNTEQSNPDEISADKENPSEDALSEDEDRDDIGDE